MTTKYNSNNRINNKWIIQFIRHYITYTYIYTIELQSTQKVTKQKDTHSVVNRETAKHLGGRHFSIAPFLRIERKRRVCTSHATDWNYVRTTSRTSSRRRCRRRSVSSLGNSDLISVTVNENELCVLYMFCNSGRGTKRRMDCTMLYQDITYLFVRSYIYRSSSTPRVLLQSPPFRSSFFFYCAHGRPAHTVIITVFVSVCM